MKFFSRIISLFLCSVTCFFLTSSAVAAATDDYQSTATSWWNYLFHSVSKATDGLLLKDILPANAIVDLVGFAFTDSVCNLSGDSYHHSDSIYGCELGKDQYGLYAVTMCKYCGENFKYYSADLKRQHNSFVDGLDSTIVSNVPVGKPYAAFVAENSKLDSAVYEDGVFTIVANKATSISIYFYFSVNETGLYTFNIPHSVCLCGANHHPSGYSHVYVRQVSSDGSISSLKSYSPLSADNTFSAVLLPDYSYSIVYTCDYRFFAAGSHVISYNFEPFLSGDLVCDAPEASSRTSSLMRAINTYNVDNSYTDNSTTVNYFLAPSGETPTSDNVVSPAIYDEETLVFTEPATGVQYQTTGWTYDYTTRTYDITLGAGTYTIDETDVTRIVSTYGDELATITYYDSSGTALAADEYSYVMMAGSACALDGHSYTYEEVKTATCTSPGERKYTCSVCGDEYAEEVPMNAHAYTYSVLKEPTCTDSGINVYTCSTCGNQVTETVEALGHDWQETSSTATTYTLPEGTSCPDCSGSDFTAVLDEEAGTYSCTCNDCGTVWTASAVITYGATTYTCSRCGVTKTESDDPESGLFNSIGDLIADGITWATDKMTQLINSISGLTDIFNDFVENVKSSAGEYPAFLGAVIALLPEDLTNVFWFGLVALIIIAVWKKWFS